MAREQRLVTNRDTRYIAFLARLVNFAEDVIDDAECETLYFHRGIREPYPGPVTVNPVGCRYDPGESVELFSETWDVEAHLGSGDIDYREVYNMVIAHYRLALHPVMVSYASKTMAAGVEYYLAILFNGEAVLLEGEEDRVTLPFIKHCLSSHTHPSRTPFPSQPDLRSITRLFLERGIGHVIETVGGGLAFYRVGPVTEDDLAVFRRVESMDNPVESLRMLSRTGSIRIMYI